MCTKEFKDKQEGHDGPESLTWGTWFHRLRTKQKFVCQCITVN